MDGKNQTDSFSRTRSKSALRHHKKSFGNRGKVFDSRSGWMLLFKAKRCSLKVENGSQVYDSSKTICHMIMDCKNQTDCFSRTSKSALRHHKKSFCNRGKVFNSGGGWMLLFKAKWSCLKLKILHKFGFIKNNLSQNHMDGKIRQNVFLGQSNQPLGITKFKVLVTKENLSTLEVAASRQ